MQRQRSRVGTTLLFCLFTSALAGGAHFDADIGTAFPESIAGLSYEGRQTYKEPGMGYSLRYGNDENIKVDIYIYNKGLEDIPEGISAEVIVREYLEALMGIRLMEQVGAYAEVKELGRKIRRYGSRPTPFLWARYEYRQLPVQGAVHEGQRISDTFVTGVRGMFLKVRMTSHEGDSETTEKVFEAFIRELSELIEKEPTTPGMRAHDPA